MKNLIKLGGGIALCLAFAGASSAADFQESMAKCLTKHANTRDAAVVMLECSATAGKLSGCKVLEDSKAVVVDGPKVGPFGPELLGAPVPTPDAAVGSDVHAPVVGFL